MMYRFSMQVSKDDRIFWKGQANRKGTLQPTMLGIILFSLDGMLARRQRRKMSNG